MILSDGDILTAIKSGDLEIDPLDLLLVNPASLDVRLSNSFSTLKIPQTSIVFYPNAGNVQETPIDPSNKETYHYFSFEANSVVLDPGDSILAATVETVGLPDYLAAEVKGKSSLARLFLDVCSYAGFIDPGFKSTVTLEITNHSKFKQTLTAGMKICQLKFEKLSSSSKIPYNQRSTSKYMFQKNAQGSKYWENDQSPPKERI